jgi:hypothetical protein
LQLLLRLVVLLLLPLLLPALCFSLVVLLSTDGITAFTATRLQAL